MLQGFFETMGAWPISQAIGASIWIYPLVQAIHLVFLALFAGGMMIVDLRLLGYGVRSKTVAQVARDARPWMIAGLIGLVCTGLPQLMQNATREYFSEYFWYKMYWIAFGLILLVTVRRKVTQANETSLTGKVVGLISMVTWSAVTYNARLIGLFT
jgi:Family of unknown function (DUF6644)